MKKIIIQVPDEFDVKVELSKGVVYLEGEENQFYCYAEFDKKGVYELISKDGEIEMRADTPNKVSGVMFSDSINVIKTKAKYQKKKKKPHPNPFTRKFKKDRY